MDLSNQHRKWILSGNDDDVCLKGASLSGDETNIDDADDGAED
jgi:hypothetical protein